MNMCCDWHISDCGMENIEEAYAHTIWTVQAELSIVGSHRDREVACSASDRQGSNFESCGWRTVSSQSSHHPQEVLLAQFSLYVHKGGLKPDSFHFYRQSWGRQPTGFIRDKLIAHEKTFWDVRWDDN